MKRSGPPARRTPLKRVAMRASRKPLAVRSVKRQEARPAEAELTAVVFARDGGCVLREQASHRCTGKPETPHHLKKSGAGGKWTDDNLVDLCAGANTMVEDEPYWGRAVGLVVRWDITPGEAWDRRVAHGLVVRTERPDL